MRVELITGAVLRFLGADDTNRLRGLNLVGVAIDEYAVMESAEVLMVTLPMLAENRGFLAVGSTPLGQNHFRALYDTALAHPADWFAMRLTVEEAYRDATGESGERVVTPAAIDEARRDGMDEATVQQEFFCSFSGPVSGSVYGKEMEPGRERQHRHRDVSAHGVGGGAHHRLPRGPRRGVAVLHSRAPGAALRVGGALRAA